MRSDPVTYRLLNLERRWPDFRRDLRRGIEIRADGALVLAGLPDLSTTSILEVAPVPGLEGPVGVGVDACGNLFVADPVLHRIVRVDACSGDMTPLRCITGPGSESGQLMSPRGVAVDRTRGILYVADTGNARIVALHLTTEQVVGIWGDPEFGAREDPTAPGAFLKPWDVAVDRRGRVYVADPGLRGMDGVFRGGRLQRFDAAGRVEQEFAATLAAEDVQPVAPAGVTVAVLPDSGDERLLVLDWHPVHARLLVFDLDGHYDTQATGDWAHVVGDTDAPVGIDVTPEGVLYVADSASGQVLVFDRSGSLLGASRPADGFVTGIALDRDGRLVVNPGAGGAVRRPLGRANLAQCGTFVAGPFVAATQTTRWHRIVLDADPLLDGAHLRLYTRTSDIEDGSDPARIPAHPAPCGGLADPALVPSDVWAAAPLDTWRAASWDATEMLALNDPGKFLWIAGTFRGDAYATPVVHQIRLHYNEDGLQRHLPSIYRRAFAVGARSPDDQAGRHAQFLGRALALFETALDHENALVTELPSLFDAGAAPDERDGAADRERRWLDWLATWVDAALDDGWTEDRRREVVAGAFRAHARRGTPESLRRAIALYTGATAIIEDLSLGSQAWVLDTTMLGRDTTLAAAHADGAVLASTAVVDRSQLVSAEHTGAPVFEPASHRFVVRVYEGDLRTRARMDDVRRIIEREKPAHTAYHLCAIEPRMRVGAQSQLGVDSIVAGPTTPRAIDDAELGVTTALQGDERPAAQRMGENARISRGATMV